MKFFRWLFTSLWVGFQVLTGQRKVMALKSEKPPVPLVVFRPSSRFLVFWPMVLFTWAMAILMAYVQHKVAAGDFIIPHPFEQPWVYLHKGTKEPISAWLNPYTMGGWWAVLLCFSVLVLRVRMKAALTVAILAAILAFYFWMDKIGKWAPFLATVRQLKVYGNWGMYTILAGIATADIVVVWIYSRFHYFIATPNKGFLVWGVYASERPIEYSEYDLNIDVEDVVERTFGFGSFRLRHKTDPSLTIEFPNVWRIAKKMSRFNELTTEWRVKAIHVGEKPKE